MELLRQHESNVDEPELKFSLSIPVDYEREYVHKFNERLEKRLSNEQLRARELLIESSNLGNVDACYTLADINLFGNYSYPTNATLAVKYYKQVAESSPNATANFYLSVIYATGLFGEIEIDQARANLYLQQAFDQGDIRAAMALGYRYMNGIAVAKDCNTALFYYQVVANNLKEIYDAALIGGPNFDTFSVRLGDFNGGLYGEGVGDTYSSLTRQKSRFDDHLRSLGLSEDSLFQESYCKMMLYYEGSYFSPRNYKDAFRYAKHINQQGIKQLATLVEIDKLYVAQATTLLGRMFLRGEGVTQNFTEALVHLKKSIDIFSTSEAHNLLGQIYEYGPDAIKDISKAKTMYSRANKTANGLYNYGRILLEEDENNNKAKKLIDKAAFHHDPSAIYLRANLMEESNSNSCLEQVHSLKFFCEKFDHVVTSLEWALKELGYGRSENALFGYAMAAEQGYETAQSSAAYILFQLPTLLETDPPKTTKERRNMAITYLTRASSQDNLDATVYLGDIYFSNKEYDKAVASYLAAGALGSSQGNFNLGWLYEHGLGVEKDFYLAKRYYDLALLGHSKAYLPVQLALLRLRFKSFFNNITGGKTNDIYSHNERRTWKDLVSMYNKVRGTNEEIARVHEQQEHRAEEPIEDFNQGDELIDPSDLVVIGFFIICFLIFLGASYLQQRNIRQRRANGENLPNPRAEFHFRVVAI